MLDATPEAEPVVERAPKQGRHDVTAKQIRGSSLLLAGRILSLAVNFAVQILIVRYLSKSDYGAFAYALSIASLGETFTTFGLDRAITRFVPIYDERGEYNKMFGAIVMVVGTILGLGLTAVLLVYGLQSVVSGSLISNDKAMSLLLILIFLSLVQSLDNLTTGMFAVFSRPRAIFFRKYVLAPGLRLTVVLVLVLSNAGVLFLAAGYVAAGAIGVAIYLVILVRVLRQQGLLGRFHVGTMKVPAREILSFTIPLLTSDLVYAVMNTSDAVLLGHFKGADAVASFRVIWPLAQMNQIVLASFGILFTPMIARLFARDDREGIDQVYWGTAVWMAIISFPIFALTFSLAKPLTTAFYGDRYSSSALYLTLLSLGYYFNAAVGSNGLTLKVFGLLRYVVVINVIAAAVNIGLNVLLIPRYGALGAAIGTCSTLIAHNLLKQWGLRRAGLPVFHARYLRVYLSVTVGAAALLLVQLVASPPLPVGLALVALASVAVIGLNRGSLQVLQTFPELMRFRVFRLLAGK